MRREPVRGMEKQGRHRQRLGRSSPSNASPFHWQWLQLEQEAVCCCLLCAAVCCVCCPGLPFASVPGHGFAVYLWWLGTSLPVLGAWRDVGTELCQACAAAAEPDPAGASLCCTGVCICMLKNRGFSSMVWAQAPGHRFPKSPS